MGNHGKPWEPRVYLGPVKGLVVMIDMGSSIMILQLFQ